MRRLVVLAVVTAGLVLPSAAHAHAEEHRSTRIAAAACPADPTAPAVGCRVVEGAHDPQGQPEVPTICVGSRRGPEHVHPWALDIMRLHVQASTGEGVRNGPVQLRLHGPSGGTVLYGNTGGEGHVDVAVPDLAPGTYAIAARFFGAEDSAVHGEPPHAYRIIYDPSSSGGTLRVLDCDEFKVTFKPTPTTARTGMVFDRSLGRATFFSASDDCIASCSDLTLVVRDAAGRPVDGARVTLTAAAFPADRTADGKGGSGRFCNARIPSPARCESTLTLTTNKEGKVDGPLRYFPPALLQDAETTLKVTVVSKGRTGVEVRQLPVRPNVVLPDRTVTIGDLDAVVLAPSAVAYKDGPGAIVSEDLSKSCDQVKPLMLLPVFKPMEKICEAIGNVFNPFGAFDKLKLVEVAWFFNRFGLPLEGAFYQDFILDDTTSDFFDAVHNLLRNAFAVYGQSFVMQSSITLKLTEVSVPPGKLALRFQATFRAPNGHVMSTIDTDVTKGYEATMFLGAMAQGRGVPALRTVPVRTTTRGDAALSLSCLTQTGCRGTVSLRTPGTVLGRTRFRLRGGESDAVKVPLTKTARRLLARRPATRVEAVLTARTAKGSATQRRPLTLRRPARR